MVLPSSCGVVRVVTIRNGRLGGFRLEKESSVNDGEHPHLYLYLNVDSEIPRIDGFKICFVNLLKTQP